MLVLVVVEAVEDLVDVESHLLYVIVYDPHRYQGDLFFLDALPNSLQKRVVFVFLHILQEEHERIVSTQSQRVEHNVLHILKAEWQSGR